MVRPRTVANLAVSVASVMEPPVAGLASTVPDAAGSGACGSHA